jgi:hypothetical protein
MQGALIQRDTRFFRRQWLPKKRNSFCASFIINGIGFFQIIPGDAVHDAFDILNVCRGLKFSFPNASRLGGSARNWRLSRGTMQDAEPGGSRAGEHRCRDQPMFDIANRFWQETFGFPDASCLREVGALDFFASDARRRGRSEFAAACSGD